MSREEAKRKELETRKLLGPRLGYPPYGGHHPTAPSKPGGHRRRSGTGATPTHPTRDSR